MSSGESRGKARISGQKILARGYREMRLDYVDEYPKTVPMPGHFFTILPPSHPLQVMRRPFAYSDADEKGFSFIYELRGPVSHDISELPLGSELDWIGPLGNPFPSPLKGNRPVLVAGGIGVGPIYYQANRLASEGLNPLCILGARTAALIPNLAWNKNVELKVCTNDGSEGIQGTAMAAFEAAPGQNTPEKLTDTEYYSCGPHPMMKALHGRALESGSPCWVSMEEMMACGVGACQGCAVELAARTPDGGPTYKRACVEGPVFDSRELAW